MDDHHPRRRRWPAGILIVIAGLAVALPAGARPPEYTVDSTRRQGGIRVDTITYRSDTLRVKGLLFTPPAAGKFPGIVFNHGGVKGISADMVRRSLDLARAGYVVLTPAYRGEGGSEGRVEVAAGEVDDALRATEVLGAQPGVDGRRIAVVGSSHGALVSVLAAARNTHIAAVAAACGVMDVDAWYRYLVANGFDVSDSLSVAVYGHGPEDRPAAFAARSAVRVASRIRCPVLLQQGGIDRTVPPDQAWRMNAALDRARHRDHRVIIYPRLGHAFWFWNDARTHTKAEIAEADSSWRDLRRFLDARLRPVSPPALPEMATETEADTVNAAYEREILDWRDRRVERLRADDGWLTVAGLFWLKAGDNRFGSAPDNDIVLPAGAPPHAGTFTLDGRQVRLHPAAGTTATVNGAPASDRPLLSDADGTPDVIALGQVRLFVITRSRGPAIRMRDLDAPARRDFAGIENYPVDPGWRIEADFVPYDPPKTLEIQTIIGTVDSMVSPGYVTFERDGRSCRLDPVLESPDSGELFYIFKDGTSGTETYPPGRFLYSELPVNGRVTLDFNKAYNPPCAFTDFATCPLPPPQNELPVAVRAGEKMYRRHGP